MKRPISDFDKELLEFCHPPMKNRVLGVFRRAAKRVSLFFASRFGRPLHGISVGDELFLNGIGGRKVVRLRGHRELVLDDGTTITI